jgi:hypothetical protein
MHLEGFLSVARAVACTSILAAAACGATTAEKDGAIPLVTATPDDPGAPDETATLEILATPSAEVKVDGKPAGKTPITGYKVPPGRHDVTFIDDTGPRTMTVNVEPGEARMVKSDRAPGIIEKRR